MKSLKTSLEGIFALDQSQFSWECVPGCWAGDTEHSFRESCPSAQFEEGAVVRGAQVRSAVHLTDRLDKFSKVDWCRTVDDRLHQNAEFVQHTISDRQPEELLTQCCRYVVVRSEAEDKSR